MILTLRQRHLLSAVVLTLTAQLAMPGCDSATTNRLPVSGSVSYQGKPVDDGAILFSPTSDGQLQANGIIQDGTYSIEAAYGPSLGEYKILIEGFRESGEQQELGQLHANRDDLDEGESYIPAEFNSETKLRETISAKNASALNFEL